MPASAKILLDSISPSGVRLTTIEATFARFVLAELNTHRSFSRNSASSRAIPTKKLLERVVNDPVIPWFGKNQSGMVAMEALPEDLRQQTETLWLRARDNAVSSARALLSLGNDQTHLHKQTVNRLLEPFLWHTVILTATEWSNFFALRCSPDAQPEIRDVAYRIRDVYETSTPKLVPLESWHTPLLQTDEDSELSIEDKIKISVARCARVSYLTHDGVRDIQADFDLYGKLLLSHHMSPFEHVARPLPDPTQWSGNFCGWHQHRKDIPDECL